jgi:hypothetical protein
MIPNKKNGLVGFMMWYSRDEFLKYDGSQKQGCNGFPGKEASVQSLSSLDRIGSIVEFDCIKYLVNERRSFGALF